MMILQRGRETVRECPSSLISGFALVLVMVLWENMDRKVCAGERERERKKTRLCIYAIVGDNMERHFVVKRL